MSGNKGESAATAAAKATKRYQAARTPQAKAKAAKSVARSMERVRKEADGPDA